MALILVLALRYGRKISDWVLTESDESLLLAVFGLTLLIAGLAQSLEVSGAVGAFLVGLALSGEVEHRALALISPLRDLFAGTFFLFFTFEIDPADLPGVAVPALALALIGMATKLVTGWYAAGRAGVGVRGRMRAGTVLMARGEFSIVIAALGSDLVDGPDLGALAASYVLITAVAGPLLTKVSDRIPVPERFQPGRRVPAPA